MGWSGKGIGDWSRMGGGKKAVIGEGWLGHGWFELGWKGRVFLGGWRWRFGDDVFFIYIRGKKEKKNRKRFLHSIFLAFAH